MLGWTLVHKPAGISSARALVAIKRAFGVKRVGHSGTLDPFAQGLLLVCFGRATRLLPFVHDEPKIYRFTVVWGVETATGDLNGDVVMRSARRPSLADIQSILAQFKGNITQTPPPFSAVKVAGQRAYKLARRGKIPRIEPRSQHIFDLRLIYDEEERAIFEVSCNRGTYVRSLAQDMARALGTCGHLVMLERLRMGTFALSQAFPLDLFEKRGHNEKERRGLFYSPQTLLDDIPVLRVNEEEAAFLSKGRGIFCSYVTEKSWIFCVHRGRCIALAKVEGEKAFPKVLLEESG